MDESTMDPDMFSSMEVELISNIKRPSLLSLSSEDSVDENILENEIHSYDLNAYVNTSTPLKRNNAESVDCVNNEECKDNYDFKVPSMFPSSRSGKRYSLSIFNEISEVYNMNKSSSMHDVSSISSFSPLRRDSCLYSTETLQSNSIATTKSKDSGFQRSTSCTSLTTNGSKKYDHVQSKVKQYIQTIKQTEALHKIQKRMERNGYVEGVKNTSTEFPDVGPNTDGTAVSKKDLLHKLKELEEELKEKDCVIEELEKNQSELRLKYAAAENQIDDLRIRASVHEDPMKNYITDEKVAELLTSNAKTTRKYMENDGVNQMLKNLRRDDFSVSAKLVSGSNSGRELQPIKKFCSNSIRMNGDYPVLRSDGILKSSSCKYVREGNYELSKSASNIDRTSVKFAESDVMRLPYEKNSFAKVQQWQRSLVNLDKPSDDAMHICYADDALTNDEFSFCAPDDSTEENRRRSRRYQKNKDADKTRYRKSYPVGCKCEKFKCKSKEEVRAMQPPSPSQRRGRLHRSVSFADYEDSMTSSLYDDGADSSSESSELFVPKHESYKDYKQRKLLQKFGKQGHDCSPRWSEIMKAKSANNIPGRGGVAIPSRNKRLIDNVSASFEYSCSDRKHCSKRLNTSKTKYRKLDDCNKVASAGCNALAKCRSDHCCSEYDRKGSACISHSRSVDACRHERDSTHRLKKLECSCLMALENLKIREHNSLAKLRNYPQKIKDKEALPVAYKRYSLQK